MRWIGIAFWIFIGVMLLWQFMSYNHHLDNVAAVQAQQDNHFYFYPPGQGPKPNSVTANPKQDGADIRQTDYAVDQDKPTPGYLTAHITLKNIGTMKASNVQVMVRPYHGATVGNPLIGTDAHPLADSDPRSQIGQWVAFPDLAPGDSATETYVFYGQGDLEPGSNPNPQILFQSDKPKQ